MIVGKLEKRERGNLALVVNNTSKAAYPRLIRTEYSGGTGDRPAHAATLDGALRAAVMRIAQGQYSMARIYDERFGSKSLAISVHRAHRGVTIVWTKQPKWGRV
jgi:hypothetical protein